MGFIVALAILSTLAYAWGHRVGTRHIQRIVFRDVDFLKKLR